MLRGGWEAGEKAQREMLWGEMLRGDWEAGEKAQEGGSGGGSVGIPTSGSLPMSQLFV